MGLMYWLRWFWMVLVLMSLAGFLPAVVRAGGGGGGQGEGLVTTTIGPPSGGSKSDSSPGGPGFGASPKAVEAYEEAGGRSGTGMSFQDWFKKTRQEMQEKQGQLEWDGWKADVKTSAMNGVYLGAQGANVAGKGAQIVLDFVPGLGWVGVGLDAARGAAEGYAEALDQGLSQTEAMGVGAKTGAASGIMTIGVSKIGLGKNLDGAFNKTMGAKSARQIERANKALGWGVAGTAVDTSTKQVVGHLHTSNVVKNSSPHPHLAE